MTRLARQSLTARFRITARLRWLSLPGALVLALALLSACAGVVPPILRPPPAPGLAPWQIADSDLSSQSLYRVRYDGPEGKASFKLTLYLESRQRFRMEAADTLGRKLWGLTVTDDERATWLDHRAERYCRLDPHREQNLTPIATLPLAALPKLLLGVLPTEPVAEVASGEGKLAFDDAAGQTWNARLENDRPVWWSLLEAGEPIAWWQRIDGDDIFSDRRHQLQLRWSRQVREAMATPIEAAVIPDDYAEGVCHAPAG